MDRERSKRQLTKNKFIIMKKHILLIILFVLALTNVFAQDTEKDQPVSNPFETGVLIDNQTTVIPDAKTLEFVIQHKFGTVDNGFSDLFGIYSPGANVRLGLNYVLRKNFQVGAGLTKKNKYTDFNAKWTIFQQTEHNKMPVAVALYGNIVVDGRTNETFGTSYDPFDRLSYFSQLIIGRKFTDWFSLQIGASLSHYNSVGRAFDHDKIGAHINGRIKFSDQSSLIFNYDAPLKIKQISEHTEWTDHPKPNLSLGLEIFTYTHAFQIYIGTADGIIPQDVMMWNQNKIPNIFKNKSLEGFAVGFTITRLWMY